MSSLPFLAALKQAIAILAKVPNSAVDKFGVTTIADGTVVVSFELTSSETVPFTPAQVAKVLKEEHKRRLTDCPSYGQLMWLAASQVGRSPAKEVRVWGGCDSKWIWVRAPKDFEDAPAECVLRSRLSEIGVYTRYFS